MRVFCVVSKFQSLSLPTSASSMLTLYFMAALALQCSVAPLTNLTDFEDSHTESAAWPFIMWSFYVVALCLTRQHLVLVLENGA